MITTIIVDDEEKSRNTLRDLVAVHCPTLRVVALCDSVAQALAAIKSHNPGLVFLDIQMPFSDGFTLLEKIKDPGFEVIFTTAYDQYALKAIKFSALDYLLKPVDVDDLQAAVYKLQQGPVVNKPVAVDTLLNNLKGRVARIAVPVFNGLQMLNVDDIVRCTADERYTQIYTVKGEKIMVSRLLKDYEDLLEHYNFFRIHNSFLINLKHVSNYVKGEGGYVIMSDGGSCEVARRKKTELLARLALVQL